MNDLLHPLKLTENTLQLICLAGCSSFIPVPIFSSFVMADTFIIYNFNSRLLRSFQLVSSLCSHCFLAHELCCFFLLYLLNELNLKESVR